MRYLFEIKYDGTAYSGWQRQSNTDNTIQAFIERALSVILGEQITSISCGRTDKGVHAKRFYFHFDYNQKLPTEITYRLNRFLPEDICIVGYRIVNGNVHARFSAVSRTYHFYFHNSKNSFLRDHSTLIEGNIDFELIREALLFVKQQSDFRSFCKSPDKYENTICKIRSTPQIIELDAPRFYISITANRFLRSMVRILAYRLIELGKGNIAIDDFRNIFLENKSIDNYKMMPPEGLHLYDLKYNFQKE